MGFLNNFLEQLCQAENLTDISTKCKAKQSSISNWSKPQDANRVLSDNESDFANHTAPELNPWLTIDLGKEHFPEYIIIQNRISKPHDELASRLSVEYSNDDKEYSVLHKGELHFGHLPESLPLILPLKNKLQFRFLKLSLLSTTKISLHLKRVNILISQKPDLTQKLKNVVFYSSRTDGLGERLKSLLNAMVLSESYNSEFKFTWTNPPNLGETHAIKEAENTFSEEFLEKHRVEAIPESCHELDKKIDFFNRDLKKNTAIMVSQNIIYKQVPSLKNYIDRSKYATAFYNIGFHREIQEAINLAHRLDIPPNTMSIHLRAGDIVYGRYRHSYRYTNKVISYAQANFIIESLKNIGVTVLVFGQKTEVCKYFSDKFGALFFGDNKEVTRLSSIQLAIFDIVLMSRTKLIFSGNSGFAQLSELIGNTKISAPEDYFNTNEMSEHIASFLDSEESTNFDRFQNAFSCWHYAFRYKQIVGIEKSILYLEKACKYDKENTFYQLVLATFYFEKGDLTKSESTIGKILKDKNNSTGNGSYNFLKNYKHPDGTGPLHRYKHQFLKMAKSNLKGADDLAKDFG